MLFDDLTPKFEDERKKRKNPVELKKLIQSKIANANPITSYFAPKPRPEMHKESNTIKVVDNKLTETPLKDCGTKNVETTKPKSKVSIE